MLVDKVNNKIGIISDMEIDDTPVMHKALFACMFKHAEQRLPLPRNIKREDRGLYQA